MASSAGLFMAARGSTSTTAIARACPARASSQAGGERAEQAQVVWVEFVAHRHAARSKVVIRGQRQFRDLEQRLEAPERNAPAQHVRIGRGLVPALLLDADRETKRGGIAGDG